MLNRGKSEKLCVARRRTPKDHGSDRRGHPETWPDNPITLKRGHHIDELCYPFIYEESWLCDYEVATDELCSHIGAVLALLSDGEFPEVVADLDRLQALAWHLNGSIRGRLGVEEADLQWLLGRYRHYKASIGDGVDGFVLPRGPAPVPQLNLARSAAKKAIRLMVRLDQDGIAVPDILHRLCNVMCNFFFVLTLYINRQRGIDEIPFVSKSYG